MSEKITQTIAAIRAKDLELAETAASRRVGQERVLERALLAASGSFRGARLRALSENERAWLRNLGVVGANGGLTAHGANVRAQLDREDLDRRFPL